jgi:hypothetical protein
VVDNLFLETDLVVSPPANDGSALVLVPADVRGAHKLVANIRSSSDHGNGANADNGVGARILKPDGLVLDGIDNDAGGHAAASAEETRRKRREIQDKQDKISSPRIFPFASEKQRGRRRSIA